MVFGQVITRVSAALGRQAKVNSVLSPEAFEHSAMCERMRVDRNGSVLAIVLMRFPKRPSGSLVAIGQAIAERLRLTDTVGLVRDGRLGLLLPDTPLVGARKVAADLEELLSGGGGSDGGPECEIRMYPNDAFDGNTLAPDNDTQTSPTGTPAESVLSARRDASETFASSEEILIHPMPWWKRGTDIIVGSLGLVVAAPLIAASAAAVAATSRGGAFFLQPREGIGGKRFNIIKIRTMCSDAEAQKSDLRRHSEQDGPAFKMTSDPRTTRVGRVLRALSLDELPQLINVIRGDMSLVGPRPLPVDESQQCEPWQRQRLQVTPGITCTWQVRARNQVPFDDWVRMDLQYARNVSPLADARLILETGPSVLISKGPR